MSQMNYQTAGGLPHADTPQWKSLGLAGIVHLLLFAFLFVGIQWQSKESTAVEAEVWDMTVHQAAPIVEPQPEPEVQATEPEPVKQVQQEVQQEDPEIAIERAKKRKLEKEAEQKKVEQELAKKKEQEKLAELKEKKLKDEADKKKLAKEKALRDKMFEEDMRRLNGQVVKSGTGGLGDAAKSTGNNRGDPSYIAKIAAKVKANTSYVVSDTSSNNPTVEFIINLFPDGSLRGPIKKTKSSGVPAFDDAVEKAIDKSQPFPRDKSGEVPASLTVTHRMKD